MPNKINMDEVGKRNRAVDLKKLQSFNKSISRLTSAGMLDNSGEMREFRPAHNIHVGHKPRKVTIGYLTD